jgi:hypothetical protein
LQLKAETHILADVQTNLDAIGKSVTVGDIGSKLKAKQDLLSMLIANEQSRLLVWLFPLDHTKKHHFTLSSSRAALPDVSHAIEINLRKLTPSDCRYCSLEDSLGGESSNRRPSCQALSVSAPRDRSSLAGAQLPP